MSAAPEAGLPAGPERRLHPLSWLFVLIAQLKSFAIPLLVLLFTGRGNDYDLYGLVGVGVLALFSLAQYFTYRYRVERDALVVRSGLFQRKLRHIPFDRIQNVHLHQTLLHRLFGVAEVRLESAGGATPEAQMKVLRLADAHVLEALIRDRRAAPAEGAPVPVAEGELLLALPLIEVVKLGLISNRGLIIVGVAWALLMQTAGEQAGNLIAAIARRLMGFAEGLHLGWLSAAFVGLLVLVAVVAALRLLSVAWALLQFYGFRLERVGVRWQVQRGLLTRQRASLRPQRIQSLGIEETWLHRWFRRFGLKADTLGAQLQNNEAKPLRDLAPLASREQLDALLRRLCGEAWPLREWHALHASAPWREFWPSLLWLPLACTIGTVYVGAIAWAGLGFWLPLWLRARLWARHAGYAHEHGWIAVSEGWLQKRSRLAETRKLQSFVLRRSPMDRWCGTASLHLDTAAAQLSGLPLRIRFLPLDRAQALQASLAGGFGPQAMPLAEAAAPA